MDNLTNLGRGELVKKIRSLNKELRLLKYKHERNIGVLTKRVDRKNEHIKKSRNEVFILNRRLYGQKLRTSKLKTQAKQEAYKKANNNIVKKDKSLLDISKYHMSILELSEVFNESPATIVVLLWASRYEYYSKKEFTINFPDSPINFVKHNTTLYKRGLCIRWDGKRSYYYVSATGKDMINRINKYIKKRMGND